MITGEPQVVMVHVIVGTGNASAAVMNASRLNVPMIFSAGRTPLTEEGLRGSRTNFIHWGQESFDQGEPAARVHALGLRVAQRRTGGNGRRPGAGNGARHAARSGLFDPAARSAGAENGLHHDSSVSQKQSGSLAAKRRNDQAHRRSIAPRNQSADYHRPIGLRSHSGERDGFISPKRWSRRWSRRRARS